MGRLTGAPGGEAAAPFFPRRRTVRPTTRRPPRISCVLVLASGLALAGTAPAAPPDRDTVQRLSAAARAAYERQDHATFLARSRALVELVPRSPRHLYNLACAQSLVGDRAAAIAALARLADWGVAFDLAGDPDLDPLRNDPGFAAVAARMATLEQPVGGSPAAFTLPETDLLAEGVAHDAKTGAFFVTGVHRRKVVRIDESGTVRNFVGEGEDGLCSAQGVVADPSRRALWVASGCGPLMRGLRPEENGRSSLFEYDIDLATLRRRLDPPVAGGRVSDLALGADGTLYAADPEGGRVYRLPPAGTSLEILVDVGALVSPQGLAPDPAHRALFVADYSEGVARVDLDTLEVVFLPAPDELLLTGMDGLVLAGDSLVAIQNGIRPHRVLRLRLDPARSRIDEGTVIERAHPRFDEPTLGVRVGSDFYYVANSQYRHFDGDGTPDLEALRPPVILRLRLPWVP